MENMAIAIDMSIFTIFATEDVKVLKKKTCYSK
jgi:hypothetical protein